MRLQRIQELIHHRPWLITPVGHETIRSLVARKIMRDALEGVSLPALEQAAESNGSVGYAGISLSDFIVGRPAPSIEDGIGYVHVFGPIGVGLSSIEKTCGATDVGDLLKELSQVQEQGASRIMLIVDSPGGTVGGVPEAAAAIASLEVPTFAYVPAGALNCSAAYYLTCGADRMYASASAQVGSIGVYMPWLDRTAAYERAGYKVELITNKEGDLKGTGFPGTQLSEAQRADLQEGIQEIFDDFAKHVRTQRGSFDSDTMRGQSFSARDAYKRGLTDGVVPLEAAARTLRRFKREE